MGKTPSQENSLNSPKSFLLLPICGLGDAVCYLPFIRSLRARYPQARILVVVATNQARDIIAGDSSNLEVIVFNRALERGLLAPLRLLWALRRRNPEVVMSRAPHDSVRVPLLAFLSGARLRIGARSERLSFLYSRKVAVQIEAHQVERYRELLAGVGVPALPDDFRPTLEPPAEARDSAIRLWDAAGLDGAEHVVGLASGADVNLRGKWNPSLKRWTIEGYAEVARWLGDEAKARIMMFGAAAESSIGEAIAAKSGVLVTNLCGKTSIGELQWLLRWCEALVCNDTGTMHVAAASGTPVVALFGPTSPKSFGPIGDQHRVIQGQAPCSPCFPHPTCDLRGCLAMDIISSQQVIECLSGLLNVRTAAA